MKSLIIYDSGFGNTEQIALAIAKVLGTNENVHVRKVYEISPDHFMGIDLLIVGSPTQRFRPTLAINNLLGGLENHCLSGVKVAAFDTRLTWNEISKTPVLAFFVKLYRNAYAAKPIADQLKKKGGELIIAPEGFFVEGMEGPLSSGEIERAAAWAKLIIEKAS